MHRWHSVMTAAALAAALTTTAAIAEDLTIGIAAPPTSIDPHFHNLGPNHQIAGHIFDALALKDEKQQIQPGLAVSWEVVDPTTWEFNLRKGVTFHDGSPFTAEDVAFTFERAPDVPNSPNPMSGYTKGIMELEIVDPHRIRIKTDGPYPMLINELSNVWVVSKKHGEGATTEDYMRGDAVIGTGPYKLVSFTPGDKIELERNDAYWGGVEPWENVTLRMIDSGPARVAALLAGDVDMIDDVPTSEIDRLRQDDNLDVWSGPSNRLVFVALDATEDALSTGMIRDHEGNVPSTNPLGDARVREALTRAIDKTVIAERVNQGHAIPINQIVPEGFVGYIPDYPLWTADPDAAKALLTEAGYPDGFQLTLVTSNDRITNAVKTVQAIAQMWTRIGVETEVETMPHSMFSPRRNGNELPVFFSSWGNLTGEASFFLGPLLHTKDKDKGLGGANRNRYSNPEVDSIVETVLNTLDIEERERLLQQAAQIVIEDYTLPTVVLQTVHWATRDGLRYSPRVDQYTFANHVRPVE